MSSKIIPAVNQGGIAIAASDFLRGMLIVAVCSHEFWAVVSVQVARNSDTLGFPPRQSQLQFARDALRADQVELANRCVQSSAAFAGARAALGMHGSDSGQLALDRFGLQLFIEFLKPYAQLCFFHFDIDQLLFKI